MMQYHSNLDPEIEVRDRIESIQRTAANARLMENARKNGAPAGPGIMRSALDRAGDLLIAAGTRMKVPANSYQPSAINAQPSAVGQEIT